MTETSKATTPERTFKIPADPVWTPNGEFAYTATTEVGFDYILEAARLLFAVSRMNGVSVQGLMLMALRFEGRAPVAGEATPAVVNPLS